MKRFSRENFDRALLYGIAITITVLGGITVYNLIMLYRLFDVLGMH